MRHRVTLSPPVQALVRQAIAELGTQAAVARTCGISRAALSSALSGTYPARTIAPLEQKLRAGLDRVACPHLGVSLRPEACAAYRSRPAPLSDPPGLRHWAACQTCPHNPDRPEE